MAFQSVRFPGFDKHIGHFAHRAHLLRVADCSGNEKMSATELWLLLNGYVLNFLILYSYWSAFLPSHSAARTSLDLTSIRMSFDQSELRLTEEGSLVQV